MRALTAGALAKSLHQTLGEQPENFSHSLTDNLVRCESSVTGICEGDDFLTKATKFK
jgi:hypothetical protein